MAAKDREAGALPEGKAEQPKKKSRLKRIVILAAILVMTFGGAGLGAYWWLYMREPAYEHPEASGGPAEMAGTGEQDTQRESQPADDRRKDLNSARIERLSDLPRSAGMVLPLPNITVNLADPGGRRYLKLGMEVEVNKDVSAELKANAARIRDSIIMLLAGKTYGDISTPDGKVLLKAEIAARLNQILGEPRVVRVYLTDFVVE